MAKAAEISVLLMLLLLPGTQGGFRCYVPCIGAAAMAVGVGSCAAGPTVILPALGFTAKGIAAGSWAAWWMSLYGGAVPAGGFFAFLQSTGATGFMKYSGIAYVNAVCTYLCYES